MFTRLYGAKKFAQGINVMVLILSWVYASNYIANWENAVEDANHRTEYIDSFQQDIPIQAPYSCADKCSKSLYAFEKAVRRYYEIAQLYHGSLGCAKSMTVYGYNVCPDYLDDTLGGMVTQNMQLNRGAFVDGKDDSHYPFVMQVVTESAYMIRFHADVNLWGVPHTILQVQIEKERICPSVDGVQICDIVELGRFVHNRLNFEHNNNTGIIVQMTWYNAITKEMMRNNVFVSFVAPKWVILSGYNERIKRSPPDTFFTYLILSLTTVVVFVMFHWPGFLLHQTFEILGVSMGSFFVVFGSHLLLVYISFISPFNFQSQTNSLEFIQTEYTQARSTAISLSLIVLGITTGISYVITSVDMKRVLFFGTGVSFLFAIIAIGRYFMADTRQSLIKNQVVTEQCLTISVGILCWSLLTVLVKESYSHNALRVLRC
jgi:hypothetical protein